MRAFHVEERSAAEVKDVVLFPPVHKALVLRELPSPLGVVRPFQDLSGPPQKLKPQSHGSKNFHPRRFYCVKREFCAGLATLASRL